MKGPGSLPGVPLLATTSAALWLLTADHESDTTLIARFVETRDEVAFAALYHRHGPMVRAVCRRYCRDPHLAADAEQGAWLVLARKAATLSRPDRLASWLFGVAVRVSRKAASGATRGGAATVARAVPAASVSVMAEELLRVLDEELTALPEDERLPLILCYLEGQTQDEAARACGTCVRTLRRRLDRGRAALRGRLERRGVAPAAVLAAVAIAPAATRATSGVLPTALGGGPVPSSLSPWIAEELAMTSANWWVRAALAASLGLGTTAAVAAVWVSDHQPTPKTDTTPVRLAAEPVPTELPKGAIARLGSTAFRHPGELQGLVFSPDSTQLAAIGPSAVSRWALPDGKSVLAAGNRGKDYCHLNVVSPDGRLAVELLTRAPDAVMGTLYDVRVTDLTTGLPAGSFLATYGEAQTGAHSLSGAISPDGSTLAIQYCAEVSLYSLPAGNLIRRMDDEGRVFRHVAFTPDGKRLVIGSRDKPTLTVHDVVTAAKLLTLGTGEGPGVGGLSISSDGKTVAVAGSREERRPFERGELIIDHPEAEFVVWDLVTGKLLRRMTTDAPIRAVRYLPDGTILGVAEPGGTFAQPARSALRRWRMTDGMLLWSAPADHRVFVFATSPDGKLMATATRDEPIRIWDLATGTIRPRTDGHVHMVNSIVYDSNGKTIRTTDASELRSWDAATGRPSGRFTHLELVGYAKWDRAGRIVAAGEPMIVDPRGTVAVFDAVAGKKLLSISDQDRQMGFGWRWFDLSADGKRLCLLVTKDKALHLQLWDVPDAKQVWDVAMPADWTVGRVTMTGDGRVLAGITDLIALDARTGKQLTRWDLVGSGVLPRDETRNTHHYPSRDGSMLGFVIQSVGIFLVDSRTGKLVRRIDTPGEVPWPLEFSADGSRFATSNAWFDAGIRVWETATGKLLARFDGSPSRVTHFAFSPDGRQLASGCIDGTALVWDISGVK